MKNLLFTSIAFFLITIECKSQFNLKQFELHGKIRSIKVKDFEPIDRFGEITNGKLLYGYDIYYFNLMGNVTERDGYYFDSFSLETKNLFKDIYKYDFNGNTIDFSTYNSEGILNSKETYSYRHIGKDIECITYKVDGNIKGKKVSKYNKNRNIIEDLLCDSNGTSVLKFTYKYDLNGNQIEQKMFDRDGVLIERENVKYNNIGMKVERIVKNFQENSYFEVTYEYELDEKRNWIKRNLFSNGKPHEIEERIIEYY